MQGPRHWEGDGKGQTALKKGQRDEYAYSFNEAKCE